jgi:hypothetical protein
MPSKTIDIKTLTRGTDVTLQFTILTSVDITKAFWTAKRKIGSSGDTDAVAAVLKQVTATLTADGQITDTTQPSVVIKIILAKGDTDNFFADLDYIWDLEVFDATNKSAIPVGGVIRLAERVRTGVG